MSLALTIEQDLRNVMPPIRDQQQRPLCLAFAASDLNSFENGIIVELSVEYLSYFAYKYEQQDDFSNGLTVKSIIHVLSHNGQVQECFWPYQPDAVSPRVALQTNQPLYYSQTNESSDLLRCARDNIANGRPSVICISLPKTFFMVSSPFQLDDEEGFVGNHAVVVVGSAINAIGEQYFLVRNSWGASWANDGHCWLSERFLTQRMFALIEGRY